MEAPLLVIIKACVYAVVICYLALSIGIILRGDASQDFRAATVGMAGLVLILSIMVKGTVKD